MASVRGADFFFRARDRRTLLVSDKTVGRQKSRDKGGDTSR